MFMQSTAAELATVLNDAREKQKLTRSELAEAAGMTRVTLRNALEGHDIRVSTLLALCDRLGLDVALVPRGLGKALGTAEALPAGKSATTPAGAGTQLDERTVLGAALQRVRPDR